MRVREKEVIAPDPRAVSDLSWLSSILNRRGKYRIKRGGNYEYKISNTMLFFGFGVGANCINAAILPGIGLISDSLPLAEGNVEGFPQCLCARF